MRLDYIKPFTESAMEILNSNIKDGSVSVSNIALEDGFVHISGVAVTSTLSGDVVGNIIIDMALEPAITVAEIMQNSSADISNKFTLSTLQELLNLIAGLFVTKLEGYGFNVDISPPLVVYGNNSKISTISFEALRINVVSSAGNFGVIVTVESEKE